MSEFRMVRQFGGINLTESRAYRVESTALMTEQEAMQMMRDLNSPYKGQKYDDNPALPTEWGTDCWGDIMSEPSEKAARAVVKGGFKLFRRQPGAKWELIAT
jgi:hypothetical protein